MNRTEAINVLQQCGYQVTPLGSGIWRISRINENGYAINTTVTIERMLIALARTYQREASSAAQPELSVIAG